MFSTDAIFFQIIFILVWIKPLSPTPQCRTYGFKGPIMILSPGRLNALCKNRAIAIEFGLVVHNI